MLAQLRIWQRYGPFSLFIGFAFQTWLKDAPYARLWARPLSHGTSNPKVGLSLISHKTPRLTYSSYTPSPRIVEREGLQSWCLGLSAVRTFVVTPPSVPLGCMSGV